MSVPTVAVSSTRTSVLDLPDDEFVAWLADHGEPPYRARQVRDWLSRRGVFDFAAMENLPKSLRVALSDRFAALPVTPIHESVSDGGLTRKALFQLADRLTIEAVLMAYPATSGNRERRTVCVSSQAGCAVGCPFCATGLGGLRRNLTAGEIVGQILYLNRRSTDLFGPGARITNVVFMGEGEPLANFARVWRAVEMLNDPEGFALGARHITISTSGLVPRIRELATRPLQVGLAVSLHAPTDELRDRLVPINRRYPIGELMAACRDYVRSTRRRLSFEYAMMDGINDTFEHADELARIADGMLCHVNLIPLNEVAGSPFQPTPRDRILAFQARLRKHGVPCTIRTTRGDPIDAACGQLRTALTGSEDRSRIATALPRSG